MTDEVFTVDGSNPVAQFVDFLFSVSERIGDLLKLDSLAVKLATDPARESQYRKCQESRNEYRSSIGEPVRTVRRGWTRRDKRRAQWENSGFRPDDGAVNPPDGRAARIYYGKKSNIRYQCRELQRAAFNAAKTPRLAEAVRIAQEAFLECYEAAYSVTQFDADFSDFETANERLNSALGEIIPFLPPAPLNTLAAQSSGIKKGSKKSSNRKPYSDDDKKLKERWQKAREAGVLKRKFCDDENITPKELGAAIDRSDYYSGIHRKKI